MIYEACASVIKTVNFRIPRTAYRIDKFRLSEDFFLSGACC